MALNLKDIPAKLEKMFAGKAKSGASSSEVSRRQIYAPMLGLLIFIVLAFYVINQVRVDGPIYNLIKANDDLKSDTAPPALYAVSAYAAANEAFVAELDLDTNTRDAKIAEVIALEKAFKTRAEYWKKNIQLDAMQNSFQVVIESNENFYKVFNEGFAKPIKAGAVGVGESISDKAVVELTTAFRLNKQAVQILAAEVEKAAKEETTRADRVSQIALIGLALLGALLLFLIWFFGMRQVREMEKAVTALEYDGQQNQIAVLNLLDEMGDLADGDLTVHAVVQENITGAIADSINYTIDSLRDLVTGINRASEQVNTATGQAQATSVKLLSAAEKQSVQITETTDAVTSMTRSILQVSSNASQASQVAQRSIQAATVGSQAVQNTIAGMNGIREQIQETSKRIKRLGESSQEIGEIVELISDITEQTNILALNAAIQAASAGEAGRGFTVVAEEVQRLAERSSEATKQIGAIVKTIQTDTNSAVAAMEKSTEGVVEGARLSDAAGRALTEIETVSNSLARLIQSISTATAAQTEEASTVTKNMQQIQEITSQTTQGTKLTAESVGQLTKLAEELRDSVAGFKLA
jgi:twitching motility protein PilJ